MRSVALGSLLSTPSHAQLRALDASNWSRSLDLEGWGHLVAEKLQYLSVFDRIKMYLQTLIRDSRILI
jgi:hypothetical protein